MITLDTTDRAGLAWAQQTITKEHYLHAPVDPRCRPMGYLVHYHYATGAHAAAGPRCVGILIVGRAEATRCYQGGLTYGSLDDVAAGRAAFDRWEVLNLARFWLHPVVQPGGLLHKLGEASGLPGYIERRGVRRSTLASTTIRQALGRVGYDYLAAQPPVDCQYPYQIRALLSYCDTRVHRGTIYRAAGFQLARTNKAGVETWWTPAVAPLTADQDRAVRQLAERAPRSQRIRAERMQLPLL